DDIHSTLERLAHLSREASTKRWRRLYLYLAGHGFGPGIRDASLLMANATLETLHHIAGVKYGDYFRETKGFSEIVLVMDCCRDHLSKQSLTALEMPTVQPRATEASFFYAFATRWSLKAREGVDESGRVRGHFTRALLEALAQPGATSRTIPNY